MLQISILPQDHVAEAVSVLTQAFMPDPIFSYYFPSPEQREEVFSAFFDDIIHSHVGFEHVYMATLDGSMIGAAVWCPPNASEPTPSDRERSVAAEQRVRSIDEHAAESLFAGFESLQPMHPEEPHWYLFFTGILPIHQGRGFGSQLLAPVLDIADRSRTVCHLETPFPQTHAFYRRLGFEITWQGNPFAGAPTLWTMTRKPRHHSTM